MGNVDGPTPCAKCGRHTNTVDGFCPACWAIKDVSAIPPRLLRRAEPKPLPTAADLLYGLLSHAAIAVGAAFVVVAALLYFGGFL
jgi:hypothetical protein